MWQGGGRSISGLARRAVAPSTTSPCTRLKRPIRRRIATEIGLCTTDKIQLSMLSLLSNGLYQRFPVKKLLQTFHASPVSYGCAPGRRVLMTLPTRPAKAGLADTIKIRDATMYDKDAILAIDSIYEKGYDPLFSQYEEHLLAPYRHCYVAENKNREMLGYFCATVVDAGTTLSFTPSRQLEPNLVPFFHDHLAEDIARKSPNLTQSFGVFYFQDGRYEPEVTKQMREYGKEIMRRPVCRLEIPIEDVMEQVQVLERKKPSRVTKIRPSLLWEFLDNTKREFLFPDDKMIICGEGYGMNNSNLDMLWGTKIRNVHLTADEGDSPHHAVAVSVRNNYLAQKAMIHFVDIYANCDTEVFDHFVSQVHDSLRHRGCFDVNHVYKAHLPAETNVDLFLEKCQEYLKLLIVNQSKQAVSLVSFEL
ncbi:uncharacterized protein LOC135500483 [Lineus longissimus]|uniref:uncharacterized protein LOC135500483 n=1 Tax=Lineus longissimus TaxID=88925 RepID=UPI002B4ED6D3